LVLELSKGSSVILWEGASVINYPLENLVQIIGEVFFSFKMEDEIIEIEMHLSLFEESERGLM
jgi:hypothetical protein